MSNNKLLLFFRCLYGYLLHLLSQPVIKSITHLKKEIAMRNSFTPTTSSRIEETTYNTRYSYNSHIDLEDPSLPYSYDAYDFYVVLQGEKQWIGSCFGDITQHNLIPYLEDIAHAVDEVEYIERVEDLLHNMEGSAFPLNDKVKLSPAFWTDRVVTYDNGIISRYSTGPKTNNVVHKGKDI